MYRHIEIIRLELVGHFAKLLQCVLAARLLEAESLCWFWYLMQKEPIRQTTLRSMSCGRFQVTCRFGCADMILGIFLTFDYLLSDWIIRKSWENLTSVFINKRYTESFILCIYAYSMLLHEVDSPPQRGTRGTSSRPWARRPAAAPSRTCGRSRRSRRTAASAPRCRRARTRDTCTLRAGTGKWD